MKRGARPARRAGLSVVIAALGAIVAAPTAFGAVVAREDTGHLLYRGGAGEINDVTLTEDPANYVFTDPAGVTAGPGCVEDPLDPTVARCQKTSAGVITIDVGDMGDETTVTDVDWVGLLQRGGPGNDTLRGSDGTATSSLIGGEGTDVYEAPGPRWDDVNYSDKPAGVTASLDDIANDPDGENVPSTVDGLGGGPGDDHLLGSTGGEYLLGGTGDDTLDALSGSDVVIGHEGDDEMDGGPGTDMVDYRESGNAGEFATVTLDDMANDGRNGEADNVRTTEWIQGSYGSDDLTGSGGPNRILGTLGNDTITGLGGRDDLRGEYGDDTINSRDGEADTVTCGSGTDTANADPLDTVADDCENVTRADPQPAAAPPDGPPTVAFAAPGEGAVLSPVRASTVTVDASDDNGVARVDLLDDGRVVASDSAAPFSFGYRPAAGDVGANALTAIAVDSASQSASAGREVRVARFRPRIRTRAVRRGEDRVRVTGRLSLPAPLTRAQGCARGRVAIVLRWGQPALDRERVSLRPSCRFRARLTVRPRRLAGSRRLRLRARFRGNALVRPRATRPQRVVG